MKEALSKQLQDQIEQEAADRYGNLPNGVQGIQRGCYKRGAKKYAALYETALARAERAEKALTKIVVISCNGDHRSTILEIKSIASMAVTKNKETLTTKTGEDELHKEP